jgi:hypothetical protein
VSREWRLYLDDIADSCRKIAVDVERILKESPERLT